MRDGEGGWGGMGRDWSIDLQHRVRHTHPLGPLMRGAQRRVAAGSPDSLRAYQERRLARVVRWAAARTPYYRRWFAGSGVDPRDVRTLDDLALLPLLDRATVAADPEDFLAYPRRLVWPARSTGSTGTPVTSYRSPGSSVWEMTALQRQWGWFGIPERPRRLVLRGAPVVGFRAGGTVTRAVPANRQLLASSFHLTPEHLPEMLRAVDAFDPEVIEAWPSSALLFADLLADAGRSLRVRAVITSSEVVTPAIEAQLGDAFGAPVVDHYGQSERVLMAGSCPAGSYHLFGDYGIAERVALPDGTHELVGTPLHSWAFPLLRYRTGDRVGPRVAETCACGLPFEQVTGLEGRVEDSFVTSDGRSVPLPHWVMMTLTGVRQVQLVQRRPGHFELRAVPGPDFDLGALTRQAEQVIADRVGGGQRLDLVVQDRIERGPGGKTQPTMILDDLV